MQDKLLTHKLCPLQDIKVEAIDYDQMVKAKEAVRTLFVSHMR